MAWLRLERGVTEVGRVVLPRRPLIYYFYSWPKRKKKKKTRSELILSDHYAEEVRLVVPVSMEPLRRGMNLEAEKSVG